MVEETWITFHATRRLPKRPWCWNVILVHKYLSQAFEPGEVAPAPWFVVEIVGKPVNHRTSPKSASISQIGGINHCESGVVYGIILSRWVYLLHVSKLKDSENHHVYWLDLGKSSLPWGIVDSKLLHSRRRIQKNIPTSTQEWTDQLNTAPIAVQRIAGLNRMFHKGHANKKMGHEQETKETKVKFEVIRTHPN